MEAPPVQYAMTPDGVRIAYTVSGSGPPLVFATEPCVSHVQLEWSQPVFGRLMRRLAERVMLIRFDFRGSGLSDRMVTDALSITEARITDLAAVTAKLNLSSFALASVQSATPAVVSYISADRSAVSRIILVDGMIRGTDLLGTSQGQALIAAINADFALGTEMIGAAAFGAARDENREYGAYIRECVGPEFFGAASEFAGVDVSALLPGITQPALVLRHAGVHYISMDTAREIAALLPNAQLAVVEGGWADHIEGVADRIADFVLAGDAVKPDPPRRHERNAGGVRTILFTDIEGHTEMMQRLGDSRGRDVLREHERITRETLRAHGGDEVKALGDGFMASFPSVTSAAQCAIVLQRAFAEHSAHGGEALRVRVGLNAGEPIAEDNDLFGSSVILAARVGAMAAGGEILVSDVVRGLLAGKGFLFNDRGETALRGFEEPVRLYELRWRE